MSTYEQSGKDYQVNALGSMSMPREAFASAAGLRELLEGLVDPRVIERLDRLATRDRVQGLIRQELLRQLLEASSSTSVSFQERVFVEEPEDEDLITFNIDEDGNVTVLLG